MKSGTTSLHEWLGKQPELWMLPVKEPHFFSVHVNFHKGLPWYSAMFADAPVGSLVGESSTSYTDPKWNEVAAERIAATIPAAKLIYVMRHPIDRLVSDLRHEIRQGRETRGLNVAITDAAGGHVRRSCYFACLQPYIERFARDQICVVRLDDLLTDEAPAWAQIFSFLGLPPRPRPTSVHNATADQVKAAWLMRWLRRRSWGRHVRRLPGPMRAAVKSLASGVANDDAPMPPLPDHVARVVWDDVAKLEAWLGLSDPLWKREAAAL